MTKGRKIVYSLIVFLMLAFIIEMEISFQVLTVEEVTVKNSKVPDGFNGATFLQITDLHSVSFGKNNKRLLNLIEKLNPDYVLCTGDIVDRDDKSAVGIFDFLEKLTADNKVYYSMGNHEMYSQNRYEQKSLTEKLHDFDMIFLNNSVDEIERNGDKINISGYYPNVGIDYSYPQQSYFPVVSKNMLINSLGQSNRERFNLMLAHDPTYFELYSGWGADLVFSGHLHGGIIRIPFVGGFLSPYFEFFPKYDSGIFEYGDSKMYVGTGMSSSYIPRFNNPPQITVVTLVK